MLKKKLKTLICFFFSWYFFVRRHCIVFVLCPSSILFLFLPCSVYDLSVVFCVSCTVEALYKCPSPLLSSGYKCLVRYVLLFNDYKKEKESKWR